MPVVRVPATSANLGPGFDALGLAFSIHLDAGLTGTDPMPERGAPAGPTHPTQVAFERAGGTGEVWVRNAIPIGRGLGFSGAARVAGIILAECVAAGGEWDRSASRALALGTELDGHADNVAASLLGGMTATAGGLALRVPLALEADYLVWVPSTATSTNESRTRIGSVLSLDDAVFNIGRTALLVAAFAAGDVSVLAEATRDAIHQDVRLALAPSSRDSLEAGLAAGALGGWLSGSGPTVAFVCAPGDAERVAAALPAHGSARVVTVDDLGARTM